MDRTQSNKIERNSSYNPLPVDAEKGGINDGQVRDRQVSGRNSGQVDRRQKKRQGEKTSSNNLLAMDVNR